MPAAAPSEAADLRALTRLLSREPEEWIAEARLPGSRDAIVLVGAGNLGREFARRLEQRGRAPAAFVDVTPALHGREVEGVPVYGLADAVRAFGETAWFAVTIWNPQHSYIDSDRRLSAAGCTRVCSFLDLAWSEPEALLPHYGFDLPHATLDQRARIERAFRLLADDRSRSQFLAHLRFRLARDHAALPSPSSPAYLDPELVEPLERVTYVDGGAYDGDTLREFLRRHGAELEAALVFEPDPLNHSRLLESISRLQHSLRSRVRCYRAALSAEDGELPVDARGTEASAIGPTGPGSTEARRLDSVLGERRNGSVLIKLDVEGHEEAAIRGAERTIRTVAPTVVACLYHRPADLWEIPLLLQSYRPDFSLYIRTEGTDGAGVVCYAVPRT